MISQDEIRRNVLEAVGKVKETAPLTPSITNIVTMEYVADAQLAAGGLAVMVHLPDEGEAMVRAGSSFYFNVGTFSTVLAGTVPRAVQSLIGLSKPWVLDPVGIGIGGLRTDLLMMMRELSPSIIRGNASEIIYLASLWGLETGAAAGKVNGVETTETPDDAKAAAVSLARHIRGTVAVSGEVDLVTDGKVIVRAEGGSPLFTKVSGSGCSLGGVIAVYAAVADPFTASMAAVMAYNVAGSKAAKQAKGPASFKTAFLDELYCLTAEEIAAAPFNLEAAE